MQFRTLLIRQSGRRTDPAGFRPKRWSGCEWARSMVGLATTYQAVGPWLVQGGVMAQSAVVAAATLSEHASWSEQVPSYPVNEYVITNPSQNKVSRRAFIQGGNNIMLGGKCVLRTGVILRGDLRRPIAAPPPVRTAGESAAAQQAAQRAAAIAAQRSGVVISSGRYCLFDEGAIVRPPYKTYKGSFSFFAVKFGDFVRVGPGSIVQASVVGSHVDIGRNCVIGRWCYIKESAVILDGTVLAPNTMVPAFTVWGGSPGA